MKDHFMTLGKNVTHKEWNNSALCFPKHSKYQIITNYHQNRICIFVITPMLWTAATSWKKALRMTTRCHGFSLSKLIKADPSESPHLSKEKLSQLSGPRRAGFTPAGASSSIQLTLSSIIYTAQWNVVNRGQTVLSISTALYRFLISKGK